MNSDTIFVNDSVEKAKLLNESIYDLTIIGSGPAGATAAMYAARGGAKTIVLDKAPSTGALAIAHRIANYPGELDEITGELLVTKMRQHASNFGAVFVQTHVQGIMNGSDMKSVFTTDGIIQTKTIFIAIGARGGRKNKILGEEEFIGRGVSYCATCDASFYKDKTVAIIGDNEEAIDEALVLEKFASKIIFFVPGKTMAGNLTIEVLKNLSKIEIRELTKIKEIKGTDSVDKVVAANGEEFEVDGVFIYLSGNLPDTEIVNSLVEITEDGYIKVNEHMETNVPGIFAGGDIRKPPIKQVVIAAADGAIAALSCEKFIHKKSAFTPQYG